MKAHHLIFLSTVIFCILFYDQNPGLNIGIFGIVLSFLVFFQTENKNKTSTFYILFSTSILSSIAYAWYGDFVSFLAVFGSLLLFRLKSNNRNLKSIFIFPIAVTNFISFVFRIFNFEQWLPVEKYDKSGLGKKLLAFVLAPLFLLSIFFVIYSLGSTNFSKLLTDYELDVDVVHLFVIVSIGFFIAFNFWNYTVIRFFYKKNHLLQNDFTHENSGTAYCFFDLRTERISGIISLIGLNILLLVFIGIFNYEQFYENNTSAYELATDTHERVNAVILSIVMAIFLILYFFKGSSNFDKEAQPLKILSKIWIFLNIILVISAVAKNSEYVINLGLTYKRLGVFAFLILSIIGLTVTFIKIQKRKTNAFLFNHMFWYFYGTVLVCSFINWGRIVTLNNINRDNFNLDYHIYSIDYNQDILMDYCKEKKHTQEISEIKSKLEAETSESFLSKRLFYEYVKATED